MPESRTENPAEKIKMGALMESITIAELAESSGRKPDTLYRKARGKWPERKWSQFSAVTESEARFLVGVVPAPSEKPKPESRDRKPPVPSADPKPKPESRAPKASGRKWAGSDFVLLVLLAFPVLASVRNVYGVAWHLSEHDADAALLTAVLCLSAPGFIVAGVGRLPVLMLALVIMAFEAFCNLAVIYGGLMGVGTTGNPTRFLGLVCDIFNGGSHGTALALGGIAAGILATVQFTAIYQLKK